MNPIFKKLNFKNQKEILVINSPESFELNLVEIGKLTSINRDIKKAHQIVFTMLFTTKQVEIDRFITEVVPKLEGDALLWICYPKKSSKKYKCDFNRDSSWTIMGKHGLEGVRQVAIDEDWSAIRFRKVEYIKKMTRRASFAITKEGKEKTTGN